jgi:hypothetical protein
MKKQNKDLFKKAFSIFIAIILIGGMAIPIILTLIGL